MKHSKLYLVLIAILCAVIGLVAACSPNSADGGNGGNSGSEDGTAPPNSEDSGNGTITPPEAATRMKMSFNGQSIFVTLTENSATKDLIARLKVEPITIEFSDFGGSEKIGYPSPALDVSNVSGCDPVAGDLTIYTPWGNLAAFYKDTAGYSNSLVLVGKIEGNGIELLAAQNGTFTVTLELV